MTRKQAIDILRYEKDSLSDSRGSDYSGVIALGVALQSINELMQIADIVEGTIEDIDYYEAMDMLYDIKDVLKNMKEGD